MENNSLLSKLNDLEARFQEVSTLITDPAVVADMKRYVKLSKEYKDLEAHNPNRESCVSSRILVFLLFL